MHSVLPYVPVHPLDRIHTDISHGYAPVEVRTGAYTRLADCSYQIAFSQDVTLARLDLVHMAVDRDHALAMVDHDGLAVDHEIPAENHSAFSAGADGIAECRG